MIKFTLRCAGGHEFESWFRDGEAFEAQAKARAVVCPICLSADVGKAIMAPAIAKGRRTRLPDPPAQGEPQAKVALLDQKDHEVRALIGAFHKYVFETAEDVGTRFAEEARKIHHGLVPERPIRG